MYEVSCPCIFASLEQLEHEHDRRLPAANLGEELGLMCLQIAFTMKLAPAGKPVKDGKRLLPGMVSHSAADEPTA